MRCPAEQPADAYVILTGVLGRVIRGLLVPALMDLLGPANRALPGWLDRLLPRLATEPGDHAPATDPEGALS